MLVTEFGGQMKPIERNSLVSFHIKLNDFKEFWNDFPKVTWASDASRIQTQVRLAIKFELLILVESELLYSNEVRKQVQN